jgi:predicted phage terminase large subunit-like protein
MCTDLMGFNAVCLPHYLTLESAPFHFEMANILEKESHPLIEIIGFRGSAKTTFTTLSYVLFRALNGKSNFIVIVNDTSEQVKGNLHNIKTELENNKIIKWLFPHVKMGHTWSEDNLLLSNGVRIIGRSRGMNIRGIRHKQYRPDLFIVDDPENTQQVKTKENRDKTTEWFNAEVVPAVRETESKLIVIGNLLHNDSFMARLAKNPLFKVFKIPLIDENGVCAWKAKYPTKEALETQRKKVGETAWAREYLLKIISEEDQVIKESDIHYYPNSILSKRDERGELAIKILDAGVGVDLAISEKQTADYTAFVSGYRVRWSSDKRNILILPNPVKKRMDYHATQQEALKIANVMPYGTKFYIEDYGYQRAALQGLMSKGISVYPMRPVTDKRARLETVAPFIKDGTVLFPETGCEELIGSVINFGIEQHDDDVDALVYLLMGLVNTKRTRPVAKIDKL